MRRRQMKARRDRLKELTAKQLPRDQLLMKLRAARQQWPTGWRLFKALVPKPEPRRKSAKVAMPEPGPGSWHQLRWDKVRQARRREGRYLLRSNMPRLRLQLSEKPPPKISAGQVKPSTSV